MNKKTIIFLIVIFIIILIIVSVFHKKSKSAENKVENINNTIGNIAYEYDTSNSIYVIYDKNTNEVLQTTYDEGMVQMYLDNPDFDPTFPGIEVEIDESELVTAEIN